MHPTKNSILDASEDTPAYEIFQLLYGMVQANVGHYITLLTLP